MAASIEDIAERIEPVAPDLPVASVYARFRRSPGLVAVPVVFERTPLGLIGRAQLMEMLADGTLKAEIGSAPVKSVMETDPPLADCRQPIARIAAEAASDDGRAFSQGIIALEKGGYAGYVSPTRLALASAAVSAMRTRQLRQVKARLADEDAQAYRQRRRQSELLSLLAREMRTPLASIASSADGLRATSRDKAVLELAGFLADAAGQLDTTLRDLMDLARLGTEPGSAETVTVTAAALAKGLGADLNGPEGPEVVVRCGTGGERTIEVAGKGLRQVLRSLVLDLNQARPRSGIRIQLSLDEPPGPVLLSAEIAHKAGPALSEVAASPPPGIGRYFAEQIVSHLGGQLDVRDHPGGAPAFTVMVPARLTAGTGSNEGRAPKRHHAFSLGRVLLVEDHEPIRVLTARAMEAAGWQVDSVADGEEAADLAGRRAYQVIVCDLHLADMRADQLARQLRAGRGPNAATPMLAVTADDSTVMRTQCMAAGFDRILIKPLRAAELIAELSDLIIAQEAAAPSRKRAIA